MIGVILGYLPVTVLFGLISLPFAVQAVIYTKKFHNKPSDMAPGNGFTVLAFNTSAITLVVTYIWLSFNIIYVLPIIFIGFGYLLWFYKTIKKQNKTFNKLKELYG